MIPPGSDKRWVIFKGSGELDSNRIVEQWFSTPAAYENLLGALKNLHAQATSQIIKSYSECGASASVL